MGARFMTENILQTAGASLAPSSELASMPRRNILTDKTSVRWRTGTGWTVVADENDRIDFDRGGVKVAVLTPGTYTTGAAFAAMVLARMTAADGVPTWGCDYGVAAGNTFRIRVVSAHTFSLLFATGVNLPQSAHIDLGYTSTDKAAAAFHVAEQTSFQSRHALDIDLGPGVSLESDTAIVSGHNLSATGTLALYRDAASLTGLGYAITGGGQPEAIGGTSDPRTATVTTHSARFVRLVITDVQNRGAHGEIGVFWLGTMVAATVSPSVKFSKENEHLSEIGYADGGAHEQVLRTRRRIYRLLFQLQERAGLAVADRALFDEIDALGIGAVFFASIDLPSETILVYCYNRSGLNEVYENGAVWAISMELAEVIG